MFDSPLFSKPLELVTKLQETLTMNSSEEFYYEHYPKAGVALFDSYAIIKTGTYFVLLAVINKVAPLLTKFKVPGAILQLLMQTLPTFLYLTNMNGEGLRQLICSSLPYWLRSYMVLDNGLGGFLGREIFEVGCQPKKWGQEGNQKV